MTSQISVSWLHECHALVVEYMQIFTKSRTIYRN